MKRNKLSGAVYRKQKKAKEEEAKRSEGSLLKYISASATTRASVSPTEPDSTASTNTDDAELQEMERPSSPSPSTSVDNRTTSPATATTVEPVSARHSEEHGATSSSRDAEREPSSSSPQMPEAGVNDISGQNQEMDVLSENEPVVEKEMAKLDDVGNWPSSISDNVRVLLVKQGSTAVQHIDSKFAEIQRDDTSGKAKGATRRLTREWFYRALPNGEKILRSWMVYSPTKASLYCFCCRLFGNTKSSFGSRSGFNNWVKLSPKVVDHEKSVEHSDNLWKWKELENRISCSETIDKSAHRVLKGEEAKWKDVLYRMLDIIRFLAKQNLALRGHRETLDEDAVAVNRGNFLELVHLLAKYDPVLREHVTKIKLGAKVAITYMSPEIQNEFIKLLGQQVRETIIRRVQKAKYFTIILDSTPDISHKDQLSQVIRYVDIDGPEVNVVESFIDFIETKCHKAEDLTKLILGKIDADGLDIQNLRGQAYDNASVMKGIHSGVQTRIKAINPKATFVACTNHSLNLAGVHAASDSVNSVTFFGTMEKLFDFFSASTGRWDALIAVTGQAVKRVTPTRWSARHEAVMMLKNKYTQVLDVLEQLTGPSETSATRSEAGILLIAMQSFTFLSFLGLWATILPEVNDTQKYLQQRGLDVHQCAQKVCALKKLLEDSRNDLVEIGLEYAKNLCEKLGIEVTARRTRKRKLFHDEWPAEAPLTYEQELRREILSSVDRIIQEIKTRFEQLQDVADRFGFLNAAKLLDPEYHCDLSNLSEDVDKEEFLIERKRLQHFVASSEAHQEFKGEAPLGLLKFIQKYNLGVSVPNIVILIRVFLTLAISVATCERSFSKLKLIKNYLRSTMSSVRLSSLAILSIEQELAGQIDFDKVITEFAARKARRIRL